MYGGVETEVEEEEATTIISTMTSTITIRTIFEDTSTEPEESEPATESDPEESENGNISSNAETQSDESADDENSDTATQDVRNTEKSSDESEYQAGVLTLTSTFVASEPADESQDTGDSSTRPSPPRAMILTIWLSWWFKRNIIVEYT